MKRMFLFAAVLVLSFSLPSCSSNDVAQVNSGMEKHQQSNLPSTASVPNADTLTTSPTRIVFKEEEPISVKGENTRFSLHSIDFINENTGWVVESAYESDQTGSQVLRTQDGGVHWEKIRLDNITLNRFMFIDKTMGWAIAQTESKTASGAPTYTMKILYTQDGGQSWDTQWENKEDSPSECGIWFQNAECGYALVSGTLLSTRDGGKQWTQVSFYLDSFIPQHMSFANADTGWVIGTTGPENKPESIGNKPASSGQYPENGTGVVVLQTVDGGKHWERQFEKIYPDSHPFGYSHIKSIDIDFVNLTTGWFLTSNIGTMSGDLYYTSNGGRDWEKINQIRSARPSPRELQFITPEVGWIPLDVGAGPIAGGLMYTRDGGKNFEIMNGYGGIDSMSEVDFTSDQHGWAFGRAMSYGDYLIHTTDGGKTWTQVYPKVSPTKDISFVDNQHGFGLGQLSDSGALLYTADGGDTWENRYSFAKDFRASMLSFADRDTGWVLAAPKESENIVILRTLDGGKTWRPLNRSIPQIKEYHRVYFRFFDKDNGLFVSKNVDVETLCRTQDGGRTWQVSEQKSSKDINQFSFISGKQGWRTRLADSGHMVELSQMKDGAAWEHMGTVASNTGSHGIEFVSKNKGWMLIGEPAYQSDSRKKLLVTDNGGQTWSSHSFPDDFGLYAFQGQIPMQFIDDQHGWILSIQGLLKTEDGGKAWTWE